MAQYTLTLPMAGAQPGAISAVEEALDSLEIPYREQRVLGLKGYLLTTEKEVIETFPGYVKEGITLDISEGASGMGNRVFVGQSLGTRALPTPMTKKISIAGLKIPMWAAIAAVGLFLLPRFFRR